MQWITRSEAITANGIPECLFDDLVAAGVLVPVKLGHRTVRFESRKVRAAAALLHELMGLLQGRQEQFKERHEPP